MKATQAGKLRHRVTIQRPIRTPNEVGDPEITWADVVTVWARVEPLTSREIWNAQQVQANVTHRVTIRYREGITPDMRIVHKGRNLNISSPPRNIEERERKIEILCKEQV